MCARYLHVFEPASRHCTDLEAPARLRTTAHLHRNGGGEAAAILGAFSTSPPPAPTWPLSIATAMDCGCCDHCACCASRLSPEDRSNREFAHQAERVSSSCAPAAGYGWAALVVHTPRLQLSTTTPLLA